MFPYIADPFAGRRKAVRNVAAEASIPATASYDPTLGNTWIQGLCDGDWIISNKHGSTRLSSTTSPLFTAQDTLHGRLTSTFPFADSLLFNVIHLNVYRAYLTNKRIFMQVDLQHHDCMSTGVSLLHSPAALPPKLLPTTLQRQVPHSNWIDYIPLAALRDNLMKTTGTFDDFELCMDFTVAVFQVQSSNSEVCGFIA